MKKIMIVDDDRHISELLRLYLEAEGFDVVAYETGEAAIQNYRSEMPDAILLDVMLPGINGFDVVRSIRHHSSVPILMLTAKGDTTDTVVGLQVGADDYIEKPFEPKELIARVQAVIRRAQGRLSPEHDMYYGLAYNENQYQEDIEDVEGEKEEQEIPQIEPVENSGVVIKDNLHVDINSYIASLNGEVIDMPPKELELLFFLAKHPNVVFSREELLEKVWTRTGDAGTRTIDVHVKRIREKFPDEAHPTWGISTVWGRGYIFKTADIYNGSNEEEDAIPATSKNKGKIESKNNKKAKQKEEPEE